MTDSKYTLIYWPGIPGRGEFIRLAFEYAKQPYEQDLDPKSFIKYMKEPNSTGKGIPYAFAPPMLEHEGNILFQTPNILMYIGERLGLSGKKPMDKYFVNELALTILDLNNEVHDSHHPIAVSAYYEDQKPESLKKAKSVREERLPKFFAYFEKVILYNATGYLCGESITYADLALFQVVDGCQFAFPKCLKAMEESGKYDSVFGLKHFIEETDQIASYLKSERREKYSMGVFRYYPELDSQ